MLVRIWCGGDAPPERFETAKAFGAAGLPKRRRPGQTVHRFHKARSRWPLAVLRAGAAGVRRRLRTVLPRLTDGLAVFGCDGARRAGARVAELEQRLGRRVKPEAAPRVGGTALVQLRPGVPWAGRLGQGAAPVAREQRKQQRPPGPRPRS